MNNSIKVFFIILLAVTIGSCSKWDSNKDRFVNTYRDILAIRMMIKDTAKANPKIKIIFQRYGYTSESFKQDFFKYSADHDGFRSMLDSAQIRAKRDYQKMIKKRMIEEE